MSSYFNNLLTTTTSRYNSLRRQLLSDDADGDTEDDSHISRVLRAYYSEKGRPFPEWLPPDPKAPQPAPAPYVSSRPPQMGRGAGGGGGGLSDLWDPPAQQQQSQEPLSLRRAQGRGGGGGGGGGRPTMQSRLGMSASPEPQAQARPLPSQRAGSYQSSLGGRPPAEPSPPLSSSGSGTTAQERLKARLWGSGRSTSPSQSAPPSAATSPAPTPGESRMRNPFDRSGAQGGGRPPYPDEGGGGGRTGLPSGPRMRY